MYYADIKKVDVANGPGVRVSLFVSGCTHKCKGCHNEYSWNSENGDLITYEMLEKFGVDSVIFTKNSEKDYSIDFSARSIDMLFSGEEASRVQPCGSASK